jgi:eukaryotic-like serine/threonine-protein kinase
MRRLLRFRLVRYTLLGLTLILVMMVSAVTAMRFAIHGRELMVPKFVGMKQADAERNAGDRGLLLKADDRFFSSAVPEGAVISQSPQPGVRVRRGSDVRVAISLGAPKTEVPNVLGQSVRAAQINIQRRGLDIGETAMVAQPGLEEAQVLAQSPPPNAPASSPRVNLLVADNSAQQIFVMPDLVNRQVQDLTKQIEDAGFTLVITGPNGAALAGKNDTKRGKIVAQKPAAGKRIAAQGTIAVEVEP